MKPHPIFNQSKYTRWYYAIIQKRAITDRRRKGEVHHILPRSLGGGDEPENLVKLTGHDHAWCHWLLTKMTSGEARASMVYAFRMMEVQGDHMERQSSYAIVRAYEKNRLEWSKTHSATMKGKEPWNKGYIETRAEVLANVKAAALARPKQSAESVEKTAAKNRGRKHSAESSEKKRKAMTGLVRGPMSDEHKNKIAQSTSKPKPAGHGAAVAAANRGVVSIHKDDVEKKVKQPDIKSYLDKGWLLGGRPRKKKQTA
jgi:hypothetical protein